ncbi:MAG TPA: M90 family metallopeptidase [Burkholderiales bacterium]|nr:M90 family metallopeptidase [Burkholderiales bacterium]
MKWWTAWKRRRVLQKHRIDEALWRRIVLALPFLGELARDETKQLRELTLLFLSEKAFTGARGLALTDHMRVAIAAQACLPILNLGLDWYDDWVGVVVYPGDFRVRRHDVDASGVVHEWDDTLAGEAMPGGPVVLSWDSTAHAAEMNVVIHEFAHKLDMRNGVADGLPPLHANMDRRRWHAAWQHAYEGFCDALERERDTWLDPYAAEHPSEFFAVLSEVFFEWPQETRRRYPDVYDQLRLFYRQDPAARTQA